MDQKNGPTLPLSLESLHPTPPIWVGLVTCFGQCARTAPLPSAANLVQEKRCRGAFSTSPLALAVPPPNPSSPGAQKTLLSLARSLEGGGLGSVVWKPKENRGFV